MKNFYKKMQKKRPGILGRPHYCLQIIKHNVIIGKKIALEKESTLKTQFFFIPLKMVRIKSKKSPPPLEI